MTWHLPAAVVAVLLAGATPAVASESAPQLRSLAEAFVSKRKPMRTWSGGAGLGWVPLSRVAASYELGYGWGERTTGLFGQASLWQVSTSGHVAVTPTDGDVTGASGLLFGWSTYGFGTWGLSGGMQVEYGDGFDYGPVVSARVGVAYLTLRGSLWLGVRGDTTVGGLLGVELFAFK